MKDLKVKICGITAADDARLACQLGAWALGLMFYPGSPRALTAADAQRLVAEVQGSLPGSAINWVGVFVNQPLAEIRAIAQQIPLAYVQLHGDESPEEVAEISAALAADDGRTKVIKALRTASSLAEASAAAYRKHCPLLLVDSYSRHSYGGTGKTADWPLAKAISDGGPTLLAGGITPANVGEALAAVGPWGIDLSSGVERQPGQKDHDKLRQLFAALKPEQEPKPE